MSSFFPEFLETFWLYASPQYCLLVTSFQISQSSTFLNEMYFKGKDFILFLHLDSAKDLRVTLKYQVIWYGEVYSLALSYSIQAIFIYQHFPLMKQPLSTCQIYTTP